MIEQITKLKKYGIFQDYKPSTTLKPFNKFNLCYGWNGSGKSTLAKLFFSLSDKKNHEHFSSSEFIISAKDHLDITQKNIAENSINLRVFNKDFIERNVSFEQSKANSIIILSEEKKEEMDNYKAYLTEASTKKAKYKIDEQAYNKDTEDLKKSLSKWASNIKKSFELIETTNSYYLNYDRTKLNNFIKTNKSSILQNAVLTQEIVKDLKNAIKPIQKDDINTDAFMEFDIEKTVVLFADIESILSKSIFSKQLNRLSENSDINHWVQTGLDIYKNHESSECEFCGQAIPEKRLEQLNEHFSKEYSGLMQGLADFIKELDHLNSELSKNLPETITLYEEFHSEFQLAKVTYLENQKDCIGKIILATIKLSEKNANPFGVINLEFIDIKSLFTIYNSELRGILTVIKKHNYKNEKFDEEVKKAQQMLELHFVSDILITENYDATETLITNKKDILDNDSKELDKLKLAIKALELVLINEAVGADSFNKSLAKFIGRKDISIEFDTILKGYKLIRSGKSEPASNLSEGEKTAIAFVYFVSKLKESGNLIESTIILVDDPISSFDSNHLFHSYSYLKQECEKAMQLFVLTHNFQYFKLVRDWLLKKNERKKKADGTVEEKIRSHFYSIDPTNEENRTSSINNANSTLLDFNSEYHYIFHKLYLLKLLTTLDLEKAFMVANLSRKLLEGFLTFKFPKGRNDFSQLLQAGCSDNETREKVYRFINKYSHNQQIEFHDSPIDNLLGEGDNIVEAVFKIICDLDKAHFDEMKEVCDSCLAA